MIAETFEAINQSIHHMPIKTFIQITYIIIAAAAIFYNLMH